jgi:hypothetical protein
VPSKGCDQECAFGVLDRTRGRLAYYSLRIPKGADGVALSSWGTQPSRPLRTARALFSLSDAHPEAGETVLGTHRVPVLELAYDVILATR